MAVEPVEDLVRLMLQSDGYFVRANERYRVEYGVGSKRSAAYSDLDLLAVKVNPETGKVTERLWAEVKAHLTSSLTPGYLRGFAKAFSTLLTDQALDQFGQGHQREKRRVAQERADAVLGPGATRRLYWGGRVPKDGGAAAQELLLPEVEIVFVREHIGGWLEKLGHQEGNEPLVRVVNLLDEYGMLARRGPSQSEKEG